MAAMKLTTISLFGKACVIVSLCTSAGLLADQINLTLTGSALGLSPTGGPEGVDGVYGETLGVSTHLTLRAVTMIGTSQFPNGTPGRIFVDPNDRGIGVAAGVKLDKEGNLKRDGSSEISGGGKHADEAVAFEFSAPVDANSIVLGLNKIEFFKLDKNGDLKIEDELTLTVNVADGSSVDISTPSIISSFVFTGDKVGVLAFADLSELASVGQISGFSVRATNKHFFVNAISYDVPVAPEPGTLILFGLGAGVAGLAARKRRRRRE